MADQEVKAEAKQEIKTEVLKEITKTVKPPKEKLQKVEREINRRLKKYIPIFDLSHLNVFVEFRSQEEIQQCLNDEETTAYAAFVLDDLHGRLVLMFEDTLSWLEDGFTTNVVLLHELMHVKLFALRVFTLRMISHKLPKNQQVYFEDTFKEIEEATVDGLARAIERLVQSS